MVSVINIVSDAKLNKGKLFFNGVVQCSFSKGGFNGTLWTPPKSATESWLSFPYTDLGT